MAKEAAILLVSFIRGIRLLQRYKKLIDYSDDSM